MKTPNEDKCTIFSLLLESRLFDFTESYGLSIDNVEKSTFTKYHNWRVAFYKYYPYSAVSSKIIKQMGLKPHRIETINKIDDLYLNFYGEQTPVYLVNIHLPNGQVLKNVEIRGQSLYPCFDFISGGRDIVLGADIIFNEDFVSTFREDGSCFEFSLVAFN